MHTRDPSEHFGIGAAIYAAEPGKFDFFWGGGIRAIWIMESLGTTRMTNASF